jgi:hypothetical protein
MYTDYDLYEMFIGLKQEMKMYHDDAIYEDYCTMYAALFQLPSDLINDLWRLYVQPAMEEGVPQYTHLEDIIDVLEREYYINGESNKTIAPLSAEDFEFMYNAVAPEYRVELGRNYL